MTTVLKHYNNEKYYVSMDLTFRYDSPVLEITMAEIVGGILTYPERKMSYPYSELKKATATYNRYVREAKTEEV